MFGYPWFGMPYYNRYSRYGYRYPYSGRNSSFYNGRNFVSEKDDKKENVHNLERNFLNDSKASKDNSEAPLFELFGISLYFDDILIICLILFLYNEGVKDESLFIALIMLLFS